MAFCVNCGEKIVDGANFCASCGSRVGAAPTRSQMNTQRQQEYLGKIFKCPYCGEVINQSATRCPSCGYEICGKEINSAVKKFSDQLMELENSRTQEKTHIVETITNALFHSRPNSTRNKVDSQIISLVKSFPIPNTIDEISEFMFLAVGNIDVNLSKKKLFNNSYSGNQLEDTSRQISNAWVAKMQQVYAKAERAFPDDPAFTQIKNIYLSKMKELKIKVK